MSFRTVNSASYNGSGEFERFLSAFKLDAKIFKWTEKDQAEVIEHYLEGKARNVFKAIDNAKKDDIKEIIKELREKCDLSPEYYMNQFCQRTMRPCETVSLGTRPRFISNVSQSLLQLL